MPFGKESARSLAWTSMCWRALQIIVVRRDRWLRLPSIWDLVIDIR